MNKTSRRGFLGLLAGVAATPVLGPLMKLLPAPVTVKAVIGQYADYTNVSDIAIQTAIDPAVAENLAAYYNYSLLANIKANTPLMKLCMKNIQIPESEEKHIQFVNFDLGEK